MMVALMFIVNRGTIPSAISSDTLLPALIGGAVGSIIGFIGGIVTTLISNHHQLKRDREAHERTLKNAKRERFRQVYAKVLHAALMYQKALAEMQFLLGGETLEERNKRISAYLAKAMIEMEQSKVDLMLEELDDTVLTVFNDVQDAFINYTQGIQTNKAVHGSVSIQELTSYKNKADEAVKKLKTILFDRLAT